MVKHLFLIHTFLILIDIIIIIIRVQFKINLINFKFILEIGNKRLMQYY